MFCNRLPNGLGTRDRAYALLPVGPNEAKLHITETSGITTVRHVVRVYAVEEQYAMGWMGRVFLLAKLGHLNEVGTVKGAKGILRTGEVYECHVDETGNEQHSCTCVAGQTSRNRKSNNRLAKVPCVHLEALVDLVLTIGVPDLKPVIQSLPARVEETFAGFPDKCPF